MNLFLYVKQLGAFLAFSGLITSFVVVMLVDINFERCVWVGSVWSLGRWVTRLEPLGTEQVTIRLPGDPSLPPRCRTGHFPAAGGPVSPAVVPNGSLLHHKLTRLSRNGAEQVTMKRATDPLRPQRHQQTNKSDLRFVGHPARLI